MSIEELNKKHGTGTLKRIQRFRYDLPVLSTGIYALDLAIGEVDPVEGTPGLVLGDVLEIAGYNNSFKTGTWEQMAVATIKRFGPQSVIGLFTEPPNVARSVDLGLDPDDILSLDCYHEESSQAQALAENGLAALLEYAAEPDIKLIIIDSVGNLNSEYELFDNKNKARALGDKVVAGGAGIFNDFCKKFSNIEGHRAAMVLVNFYREAINTMSWGFKPTSSVLNIETGGGRGKEFLSAVRVICSSTPKADRVHSVLKDKVEEGRNITYKIFKNKTSKTYGTVNVRAEFDYRTKKINNPDTLINWAEFFTFAEGKEWKSLIDPVIRRSGAYYYIGDAKFQGMAKASAYLHESPEVMKKILIQLAKPEIRNMFFEDVKRFKSEAVLDD